MRKIRGRKKRHSKHSLRSSKRQKLPNIKRLKKVRNDVLLIVIEMEELKNPVEGDD